MAAKRPGRCGPDGRQGRAGVPGACGVVRPDRVEGSCGGRIADVGRHVSLARDDAVEIDPCGVDRRGIAGLRGRSQGRHAFGGLAPPRDAPSGQRIEDDAADHGRPGRGRPPQHEPVAGRSCQRGIKAQHGGRGARRQLDGVATTPTNDGLGRAGSEVDPEARPVRNRGRERDEHTGSWRARRGRS